MLRSRIFTAVLVTLSQAAFAQSPPSSGSQLQQIPDAPTPQRAIPEIRIEQDSVKVAPSSDQFKILVNSLRVTGQSAYTEAELLAVTGFMPGIELTLTELRSMAAKIADHYRRNGYFLAQAYLPAQELKDGTLTIVVLEGRYGNITLRNTTKLPDSMASGMLEGLNTGDTIVIDPLENRLLLLSDIPGVNVKSTLAPGASVGTSDLIVDVTPGQSVTGNIEFDNAGNRYTGEYRLGATVNFNNLAGLGDVLSFRGMTSGSGLNYGRASYQIQLGKATVGVAYTALEYELGKEFAPLQAHGTAQIESVFASYPLIRSRNSSLYAVAGLDAKQFTDKIDATATVTDKDILVGMLGLHGNHRDRLGGGGLSAYSLTWSRGNLDIETPAALAADAATSRANGHYNKLSFTANRLQSITENVSLYGGISGQLASKNLDISEKMGLGGMYGVRAYPVGEAYADEGYLATLEARLLLPKLSEHLPGRTHLIGFVDTGSVTINKEPWTTADNHRTLSGYGVGLTWADYNNFVINTYYARKLGNERATSAPDKNGRFWIQMVKYF